MADQVNEYGVRVWKDSKGAWRKVDEKGKRTSQFASAPVQPKTEPVQPVVIPEPAKTPAPEIPRRPMLPPSSEKRGGRGPGTALLVVVFLASLCAGALLWTRYIGPWLDGPQTADQNVPLSAPVAPDTVAANSDCNVPGTVRLKSLGRCVYAKP